jgi:rSAM/selenodomain-associated transferase 1
MGDARSEQRLSVRAFRRRLVIMVKQPIAGRVKTRLGRDVGAVAATMFYRHTMANLAGRLVRDARWQTLLSVAPAVAVQSAQLPGGIRRVPQVNGDLGARMQAIFGLPGRGPIVIIGTDIPEVRPSHISAAFSALGSNDMVFGPATDGGFWLVGMRRTPRLIKAFRNVRWSSPDTLQDCFAGLAANQIGTVRMLRDVDDMCDLNLVKSTTGRRILPLRPEVPAKIDLDD